MTDQWVAGIAGVVAIFGLTVIMVGVVFFVIIAVHEDLKAQGATMMDFILNFGAILLFAITVGALMITAAYGLS